jgi:hypothetical protein
MDWGSDNPAGDSAGTFRLTQDPDTRGISFYEPGERSLADICAPAHPLTSTMGLPLTKDEYEPNTGYKSRTTYGHRASIGPAREPFTGRENFTKPMPMPAPASARENFDRREYYAAAPRGREAELDAIRAVSWDPRPMQFYNPNSGAADAQLIPPTFAFRQLLAETGRLQRTQAQLQQKQAHLHKCIMVVMMLIIVILAACGLAALISRSGLASRGPTPARAGTVGGGDCGCAGTGAVTPPAPVLAPAPAPAPTPTPTFASGVSAAVVPV